MAEPAREAPATLPEESAGLLEEAAALTLLRHGELEPEGLLADASNATLRAVITHDGVSARCIYKPVRGERPLWDFPDGTLAGRELAAYRISVAGGWDLVPPTVLRDGPLGPGACQLWIDQAHADGAEQLVGLVPADDVPADWLAVAELTTQEGRPYLLAHADDPRLAAMAVFDAVINNADRKGGHLLTAAGRVYGVDHGVCLHTEDKLRTVLWGWADEPLGPPALDALRRLRAMLAEPELSAELAEHITIGEITALSARIRRLLATERYPEPYDDRPLPWPPM
ncbi:MAG: SCO1664 family protein [Micromonosporaceae bacterium]